MNPMQIQVREFHEKVYGVPSLEKPEMPSLEVRKLRVRLIAEELYELAEAFGLSIAMLGVNIQILENEGAEPDLVLAADATADLKYVVIGTDVAMGVDGEPVWQEVHRSNMTKFIDGHRREDGKWIKGPSYSPANIAPILEAQSK
jgi:predicted HAD superfamily Cof-like phosphohydrolase